jgi:hypothetical protein
MRQKSTSLPGSQAVRPLARFAGQSGKIYLFGHDLAMTLFLTKIPLTKISGMDIVCTRLI